MILRRCNIHQILSKLHQNLARCFPIADNSLDLKKKVIQPDVNVTEAFKEKFIEEREKGSCLTNGLNDLLRRDSLTNESVKNSHIETLIIPSKDTQRTPFGGASSSLINNLASVEVMEPLVFSLNDVFFPKSKKGSVHNNHQGLPHISPKDMVLASSFGAPSQPP